jgi:hypothetical protein
MGVLEEQEKERSPAAAPKPHFASGADELEAVLHPSSTGAITDISTGQKASIKFET